MKRIIFTNDSYLGKNEILYHGAIEYANSLI